ncbi:MAG: hypothetical protein QM529_06505 [Hydrotalea sp.]|nr:hypothetical protein [Hydrotalea sp.]
MKIDKDFIEEYSAEYPNYTTYDKGDVEYNYLINQIKKDKNVSKDVFARICLWKSGGDASYCPVKSKHFNNFNVLYKDRIDKATEFINATKVETDERGIEALITKAINILDEAPGIGVVYAATILHFIFPDEIPIIDRHAIGTLKSADKLNNNFPLTGIEIKHFIEFKKVIFEIKKENPTCSLREIDRALYTYDKTI